MDHAVAPLQSALKLLTFESAAQAQVALYSALACPRRWIAIGLPGPQFVPVEARLNSIRAETS